MPTWTAISKTDHQHTGWTRFTSYQHARNDVLAAVVVAEITQLLPHYALAFSKTNPDLQDSSYQLVALLSLQAGLNLYLDESNQWQAPYVPARYRSYPFNLLPNQNGDLTLCFDQDSGLIHTPAQQEQLPLLDDQGQPSEHLAPTIQFLQQLYKNRQLTQTLVDQLADHGLIQSWEITSAGADGEPKPVKGLYHINEAALKALDSEPLAQLNQSGALGLAYGQLYSQARLQDFKQRFARHQRSTTPPEVDIDALFGEKDDSLFKF